jgi:hypothetical protein
MTRVVFLVSVHCEDTSPDHLEALRDDLARACAQEGVRVGAVEPIVPLNVLDTADRLFEDARRFEATLTDPSRTREELESAALHWCFRSFADPADVLTAMEEWRARETRRRQGSD